MIAVIIILVLMVVVLGYTTFNLLKKNEKAEDIINSQVKYINEVSEIVQFVDKRMGELDNKGTFESDDEIGFFFQRIKLLNDLLKKYQIKV
jgi:predicted PurR-regulated permease PerM